MPLMSKTYLRYEPVQSVGVASGCRIGCLTTMLAYSYVVWTSTSPLLRAGTAWRASVSSTDPGQGDALWLLRRGGMPRRIAQRLHEESALGVGGEQHTGLRTISDFRKDNLDALSGLYHTGTALCHQAGLV